MLINWLTCLSENYSLYYMRVCKKFYVADNIKIYLTSNVDDHFIVIDYG